MMIFYSYVSLPEGILSDFLRMSSGSDRWRSPTTSPRCRGSWRSASSLGHRAHRARAGARPGKLTEGINEWINSSINHLPSGYVKIAIENDHKNSGFSQLEMVISHSYVSLPEGIHFYSARHLFSKGNWCDCLSYPINWRPVLFAQHTGVLCVHDIGMRAQATCM